METITVKDVEKNSSGWYEVTLEDGRTASTKNQAIADAAFASRGTAVEAEINSVVNGKFTNTYLNKFGELSDSKPKSNGGGSKPRTGGGGKSPQEQERIARQWSVGRAVELFIASGDEFTYPLDDADLLNIKSTADILIEMTK